MFDNLGNFLQVASGILVISSLAGLGLMRGTIVNLRENLADARAEIADKDRRITQLETDRTVDRGDLDALRRVVTGEAHWTAIEQKLEQHHDAAVHHWQADEELLGMILQSLNAGKKP